MKTTTFSRKTTTCNSDEVKNKDGKVVHDLSEVVKVLKSHFETLRTEKHLLRYDKSHYEMVSDQVKCWSCERDSDRFLEDRISPEEMLKALKKLNRGKAASFNGITSEHLQYTGTAFLGLLVSCSIV